MEKLRSTHVHKNIRFEYNSKCYISCGNNTNSRTKIVETAKLFLALKLVKKCKKNKFLD